jgi:hypothetical protein
LIVDGKGKLGALGIEEELRDFEVPKAERRRTAPSARFRSR